ncbi:hypothetical protein SCB49_04805 [unidentified eubacterium SCB49]|nr:hypothetical protein SCB49_04805 [unidentified eubacterium SCB49]
MLKNILRSGIIFIFCFLNTSFSWAQDDVYQANYTFDTPEGSRLVSKAQYEHLTDIVKDSYSSKNLFSNQSPFIIVPKIRVLSEKTAGEVQVVKVVKVEIKLSSQGKSDDYVFNTIRKVFTLTAPDAKEAISDAINKFSRSAKIKTFFDESNQNIVSFYQDNCDKLLSTVKVNIEREEYAKAIAHLKYVPESVTCFKEAEGIITNIFKESKEEHCKILVQKAHAQEVLKDYTKALFYLQFIDPSADCYATASELITHIGERVDEQVLRDFEMEKLTFSKLSDIKKMDLLAKHVDNLEVVIND